ncbi:MAG: hypothetical protein R2695_17720 [Acidimicrobiales bacterium]
MMKAFPDDHRTAIMRRVERHPGGLPGARRGDRRTARRRHELAHPVHRAGHRHARRRDRASRVLPETERQSHLRFDLLGGVLLGAGIAAVLIPLNRARRSDGPTPW